jgi:penicillin amidase
MDVRHEEIRVRGEPSRDYLVRQTHLGPVATAFCFARDGEQVALKRIPTAELDRETIEAALGMWRARDAEAFLAALPDWRFPSCNMVFGDREGKIGYQTLAAVPIRSEHALEAGRCAHQGTASRYDWQGIVPYDLLPHVLNPGRGYLSSGNHRAIESWYPISFGIVTGGGGDTVRSWRLRELLEARDRYTPEDVLEVHHDSVNPARRDIVRLGLHLRDTLKRELSQDAMQALEVLDDWYRAGASSDLANPGAELATEINTFFRMVATDLAFAYGGGESGLAYFLKTATARLDADPSAPLDAREQDFIDTALAGAWQQANRKYGRDTAAWNARAREQITQRRLGYAESLDGFPSLAADLDLQVPALTDVDGGTIKSQAAQSYTQWVPMHDPDLALSVLPIGTSERPADSSRTSTMELWSTGQLHPAPLSRAAVLRIAQDRRVLREE